MQTSFASLICSVKKMPKIFCFFDEFNEKDAKKWKSALKDFNLKPDQKSRIDLKKSNPKSQNSKHNFDLQPFPVFNEVVWRWLNSIKPYRAQSIYLEN